MRAENRAFFIYSRSKTAYFLARAFGARECCLPFMYGRCAQIISFVRACILHTLRKQVGGSQNWTHFITFEQNRLQSLCSRLRHSRTFASLSQAEGALKIATLVKSCVKRTFGKRSDESQKLSVFALFSIENRKLSELTHSAFSNGYFFSRWKARSK